MLSQLAAQNENEKDTITIFINTKKIAQYVFIPGQTTTAFTIKKSATKNIKQIALQVKGPVISNVMYAGTLEIAENNILSIAATKDNPGHFNIVNATFNKLFLSGKKVPLYLMLNPADPMLMIPSKRIFLGNLIMK